MSKCFLLLTASDILCFAVFLPSNYKAEGACKIELTASLQNGIPCSQVCTLEPVCCLPHGGHGVPVHVAAWDSVLSRIYLGLGKVHLL